LGAELLDRSVKPPRLNSLGTRVLEQARDLLQRTETLKSLASRDAEPHGLLRIGLDVAAVLLPEGRTGPPPLLTNIIATDRVEIVQGTAGNVHGDWKSLGRAPWVLNPPGCLLRANLIDQMDRAGFTPMIAATTRRLGEGRPGYWNTAFGICLRQRLGREDRAAHLVMFCDIKSLRPVFLHLSSELA
jgi:DNA-binding transcriptional LysR family regulator